MAKSILAGEPLSHNDLRIMVHIFEQSFDSFLNHNAHFFSDYFKALRTLVGLGFTAALADRSLLYIYHPHFARFLFIVEADDFKSILRTNRGIAQSLAEMIHIASTCFYLLKFPGYYHDFIAALRDIFIISGFREHKEAERILDFFMVP